MNESDYFEESNDNGTSHRTPSEQESVKQVYLLNQPLQCLAISLIILVAIVCNSLVIHNICMCPVSCFFIICLIDCICFDSVQILTWRAWFGLQKTKSAF